MHNKHFFDDWKEFTLQKPDKILLNHLEIIKNQTDSNGSLKHKNLKEINKIFALFITHNYGSTIYELCNFLKYFSQKNLLFYNLMIMNNNEIIGIIKNLNLKNKYKISNKITLELKGYKFDITYSRFSNFLIILDFLEEFLGLEEIMVIDESIKKAMSKNDLQKISNDISKKVYSYLKKLLPTSHLQRFSSAIGNYIVKKNKDKNHKIVSADISDDFIFDFWVFSKDLENDLLIKTYKLAVDLCFTYKKSIEINENYLVSFENENNKSHALNLLSNQKFDQFLEQIITNDEHIFSYSFKNIMTMQENKVNILKKNELNEIKNFAQYNDLALKLPLTILRVSVFGNIQNKIIESQRRKKLDLNLYSESFLNTQMYNNQVETINNITNNISYICDILFYKLWLFKSPKVMNYIKNYLNKNEIILIENFIDNYKAKIDIDPNLNDIDLLREFSKKNVTYSPDAYREKQLNNLFNELIIFINSKDCELSFKHFLYCIVKLKKKSSSFRRAGFDFNINNEKNRNVVEEIFNALLEIKKLLFEFVTCLDVSISNLNNKFKEDKVLFFKHFKLLYEKEGV
jgi:hypothetical protein